MCVCVCVCVCACECVRVCGVYSNNVVCVCDTVCLSGGEDRFIGPIAHCTNPGPKPSLAADEGAELSHHQLHAMPRNACSEKKKPNNLFE